MGQGVMWGPQTLTNDQMRLYMKKRDEGTHKSSVTPGKCYPADFLEIIGSQILHMLNDHPVSYLL